MITITINGNKYKGNAGETIYEVAAQNGIEIPTLCHDPRLEPYSSCFVCVVEIEGSGRLQPSCSTRIADGMSISTDNERVTKARKTALDLLLSNHYADCAAPCKETCPAGVDVQGYISLIEKQKYSDAIGLIKEVNPLPAICGRVCVRPCEVACRRNLLDEGAGVGIDYMKRFAADQDLLFQDSHYQPEILASTGKKVAVIGAGPGGLSTAWFLQQKGHQVDIYEAHSAPGGMLRYGIPEYRLPNEIIDKEVERITDLGVKIFYEKKLGKDLSYSDLQKDYDSTILTIGSQRGTSVGCDGDDAENVYSGIDFLRNMQVTGKKADFTGKTVAVVGGGNTAMDCCRTAMRCGAEKIYVIYRRTEKEMPANPIEIHESKLEGIEYLFLTNPVRVNKDADNQMTSMTIIRMELGEPDKSGRRRPIPIKGSEFELELDYVLAAIGQKTVVDFIDDINTNATEGQLVVNRWGDIDANRHTLQTGIPSVFAAGDGVTGPATLIEAIKQAQVASYSCHQFLSGEEVCAPKKEFISKKDNFKEQTKEEYAGKYLNFSRKEMPTLPTDMRVNFDEVELGYENKNIVTAESQRCLECGCTEYFTCDLKKYATEYEVEQNKFEGQFNEHKVDFSHPFIEIDNNKCILCARCVRICRDVVGASALGLIDRGFDTVVAPAMGKSLQDTNCESCGLCISACPTGAMVENFAHKPGPVKSKSLTTISPFGSIGEKIQINHSNGFIMNVEGVRGLINSSQNISRQSKFGYRIYNETKRITKPLRKINGEFVEITFQEAYQVIKDKITSVDATKNAFFAGGRLTNEEIFLVQKLARAGAKTNNISSFQYMGRGKGYDRNSVANVPFNQLDNASKIYLFGTELYKNYGVLSYAAHSAKSHKGAKIELVTDNLNVAQHKYDDLTHIKSYYHFIRATNHYIVANKIHNKLYINHNCEDFEEYKVELMAEDYNDLLEKSGVCCSGTIIDFATEFNKEPNAVVVFAEKDHSTNTCNELFNLALMTGKLGKTAQGLISVKESANSQGLFDMGAGEKRCIGGVEIIDDEMREKLRKIWNISEVPAVLNSCMNKLFIDKQFENLFIFGEDPIGCAIDKELITDVLGSSKFIAVQEYFMSETAKMADLILPATFNFETGGSFTNTQRMIQTFEAAPDFPQKVEKAGYKQVLEILASFGLNGLETLEDVRSEAFTLLPANADETRKRFISTGIDNANRMFEYGCDGWFKHFEDTFDNAFY